MNKTPGGKAEMRIGVLSDTHGRLSDDVKRALAGVHAILHAGDIGSPDVLDALRGIARVTAVRGNMDGGVWAWELPETDVAIFGNLQIYLLHDLAALDLDPASAGFHAVISGHTHRPAATRKDGVLYINPGSASYPKFNEPASIALIRTREMDLNIDIIQLPLGGPGP